MTKAIPKFTPGPWYVRRDIPHLVLHDRGISPAHTTHPAQSVCACIEVYRDANELGANAHLIAAAPDMYNLLQELVDDWDCPDTDTLAEYAATIERLLRKARGENKNE